MCGIAGYVIKSDKFKTSLELVKEMTDKMIHRGPDAEGQWVDQKVALGHRRLSIIDLDARSNQPMFSHDRRYIITYNGEVYNYQEIKEELLSKGAVFKTNCDTEVILEAYREYGVDCFNKFNGMWALAIYDTEEKKIILCRDRLGVKPLYILDNSDIFVFASEMKAILAAFPEENILNETWVFRYIMGIASGEPDEETVLKNIKIFPKAHYMIYDLKAHKETYKQYWEIDEQLFSQKWIQNKNPVKTFRMLFEDAVKLRLRADVEVGAALSGGLDSSAIVGCASRKFDKRLHTFSSIYQDKDCNEEPYIRKVNEQNNTIPHYVEADKYEENVTKCIEDLIYHQDWPFPSASEYSGYIVKRETQKYVKISLSGQGADELFAGYPYYFRHYIYDLLDRNTFWSRCKGIKVFLTSPQKCRDAISTDTIVRLVGVKNCFMFQGLNSAKTRERELQQKTKLFTDEFLIRADQHYKMKEIKSSSRLNTALCNDIINQSLPLNIQSEDGESMAFSIESRMPFLDYRIVEFAIALDGKYKIKGQWSKWIIRKACKKYMPKEVTRRNKMGFPAPFARWLREGKNREEIREIIYAFGCRGIVPAETIDTYYKAHVHLEGDFSLILYRFYSMELWMRIHER